MSKNEQFDGETTEVNSGNRPPKKNKLGKVFLVALCAGVIGGGAVVGGYSLYQNYSGSDAHDIFCPEVGFNCKPF